MMERHPEYTRVRLQRLADAMREKIYTERLPVEKLLVAGPTKRVTHKQAQKLRYRTAKIGEQFGPAWSTFWFRAGATVPAHWAGKRVDLIWNSNSEATLWMKGRSAQGLNYTFAVRTDAVLTESARAGENLQCQIEMACNTTFGDNTQKPFSSISAYVLDRCEIAVFDAKAWELYWDFYVLQQLQAELDREGGTSDKAFSGELLFELNRFANEYAPEDRSTWQNAQTILRRLYTRQNATQAHELSAVGHAHMDLAWLWPMAETVRKLTRTYSSQVAYMERYPDYKFAASSAGQYEMVKENNPDLWERIKAKAAAGQWFPVGGSWIEPDCNIPSGEALSRQFLLGQKFFEKEFGARCTEFWNPDVFGYNGQLPQILRLSGIHRFLTQKLSWNKFNRPRYHTFHWEGIDGSRVLTHFPPADTYGASVSVEELRRNMRNYNDHDRSRHSIMLFGHGDGGGGPTKEMIETASRIADLQGLPRTKMRSPHQFFDLLEADAVDLPSQIGELYFEYHRGTYTSQAHTKRMMRRSEFLLHDVEFLSAVAWRLYGFHYPALELDRLWKLVLRNQFHDILPGSSINAVYEDSASDFAEIMKSGEKLRQYAIAALDHNSSLCEALAPLNTIGFNRHEVVTHPSGKLVIAKAPAYGVGRQCDDGEKRQPVTVTALGGDIVLENAFLRARLASTGRLISLFDKSANRESLRGEGNRFQIYEDKPNDYDAWDADPFHLETEKDCEPAHAFKVTLEDPLRSEVRYDFKIAEKSSLSVTVRLEADSRKLEFHCNADWHESHKFLKVMFPVNVRAMNATYEMQFGVVERPTHFNTTFDLARYEVAGHKWADLSEHGYGVALLTESKYGFSTKGNEMRVSLLRAPKFPDPQCDMGKHEFAYAIMPHEDGWQEAGVVAEAYRFNSPLAWTSNADESASFAASDDDNLVLDTIKKAEDEDALILRLYEAHGARGTAHVKVNLPFSRATFSNILEDDGEAARVVDGCIEVPYAPFQIITLKLV